MKQGINKEYVLSCLCEFDEMRKSKNEENNILEAALFVEDIFGIVLSDEEICKKNLKGCKNLETFVLKKCGL